jgi:polyvinyl alcohol dehydrogenase (cytochrome)
MFFYSRLKASFRTHLSLAALLSAGLIAAQPSLAQEQATEEGDWVAATMCAVDNRAVDLGQGLSFSFTGADGNNPRHLDAAQAGLTTGDMSKLELAWAVAFPETSSLRAAPVIVGSTIFYSATDSGRVFALDTNSGCAKWVYNAGTRLRSSLAYGVIDGLGTLVFGDGRGMIHSINAENGEAIWVASGQASNNQGMLTGTPVIYEDKIIVPISGSGVALKGIVQQHTQGNIEFFY